MCLVMNERSRKRLFGGRSDSHESLSSVCGSFFLIPSFVSLPHGILRIVYLTRSDRWFVIGPQFPSETTRIIQPKERRSHEKRAVTKGNCPPHACSRSRKESSSTQDPKGLRKNTTAQVQSQRQFILETAWRYCYPHRAESDWDADDARTGAALVAGSHLGFKAEVASWQKRKSENRLPQLFQNPRIFAMRLREKIKLRIDL
jgi:hypothetical protein